jgi:predicted dehydrogenase
MPSIHGGELEITKEEPLKRELADFVDAVRSGREPLVTGEQGRRALSLAQQIVDRMNSENTKTRKHENTKDHIVS